jgi:hypothetical protein
MVLGRQSMTLFGRDDRCFRKLFPGLKSDRRAADERSGSREGSSSETDAGSAAAPDTSDG